MTRILIWGLVLVLTGCSSPVKKHFSVVKEGETPDPSQVEPSAIVVVADNQFHNIFTSPELEASIVADKKVPVAIRPPQLNLFAPDLYTFVLSKYADGRRLIHLGDALNISSSYEWALFSNAMNRLPLADWAMAPGNHDAYYYGLGAGKEEGERCRGGYKNWCVAASTLGHTKAYDLAKTVQHYPFTKDIWIVRYLRQILEDEAGKSIRGDEIEWRANDENSFVIEIKGKYYKDDRWWKSFLVQKLLLSQQTYAILLDTTNYHKRPTRFTFPGKPKKENAGLKGEILPTQQKYVKEWLDELKSSDSKVVLMGHHPYKDLTPNTQSWLEELFGSYSENITRYVSAHTHNPAKIHDADDRQCRNFPQSRLISEVNIGSITDTPLVENTFCKSVLSGPQLAIMDSLTTLVRPVSVISPVYEEAQKHNLEPRLPQRYLEYRSIPWIYKIFDFKRLPHRKAIVILAETYVDMFETLGVKNKDSMFAEIISELKELSRENPKKMNKDEAIAAIAFLRDEVMSYDKKLRENGGYNGDRQLYGAWEALQASLAEGNKMLQSPEVLRERLSQDRVWKLDRCATDKRIQAQAAAR